MAVGDSKIRMNIRLFIEAESNIVLQTIVNSKASNNLIFAALKIVSEVTRTCATFFLGKFLRQCLLGI